MKRKVESDWPPAWTKKQLHDFLEKEAKEYRNKAMDSVIRNLHMNELSEPDLNIIRRYYGTFGRFIDALLVDFINHVAQGQGCDLGLYVKHLKKRSSK